MLNEVGALPVCSQDALSHAYLQQKRAHKIIVSFSLFCLTVASDQRCTPGLGWDLVALF